ncbi:unnamed protein product [Caenorhabditis auriculariae]|uniref:Uncharacterized protein n=1 Tax=Caenorhabditis auriculariae TaxID=2777116 RepID=A0A8S1HTG1_9PELO|nr:unnamed protein product [Caenorhabditis auriculariae]
MSSLEKPTSHQNKAQDVTKLPIFASAPASLKPFIQGKTIVEVIANLKDNVENADDNILDDFDAWMRKLNPNYCAPVRDPHFIRIAKDKETLRTLFRSDRFELKQKTAFMEKTLINESRDVIKEFCSWKFENLGEDYPFLSLIRDAACRKLLLNIMSNPDNGDTVKLEKLDKALSGMNDRSAKIIYENWRKTIDAEVFV